MKKTMPDCPPSALRCSGTKPLPQTCCGLTAGRSRGLNLNVGLSQQWPIRLPKGCPKICFCLHFSARLCILLLVLKSSPSTKYASVERLSLYRSRRFESPWGRRFLRHVIRTSCDHLYGGGEESFERRFFKT